MKWNARAVVELCLFLVVFVRLELDSGNFFFLSFFFWARQLRSA